MHRWKYGHTHKHRYHTGFKSLVIAGLFSYSSLKHVIYDFSDILLFKIYYIIILIETYYIIIFSVLKHTYFMYYPRM